MGFLVLNPGEFVSGLRQRMISSLRTWISYQLDVYVIFTVFTQVLVITAPPSPPKSYIRRPLFSHDISLDLTTMDTPFENIIAETILKLRGPNLPSFRALGRQPLACLCHYLV